MLAVHSEKLLIADGVADAALNRLTGTVLAGSIGSAERSSYALVGDAVNLASRIQGLNKELGTEILVSEATRTRLGDDSVLQALPAVRVKGKSVEVSVYRAA